MFGFDDKFIVILYRQLPKEKMQMSIMLDLYLTIHICKKKFSVFLYLIYSQINEIYSSLVFSYECTQIDWFILIYYFSYPLVSWIQRESQSQRRIN